MATGVANRAHVRHQDWLRVGSVTRALAIALACMLAGARLASGQAVEIGSEPGVPEKAGKELRAFRIRGAAPRIDGQLDDEVWNAAERLEDLGQEDPDNMQPPTERTAIQIAYDDRYLYVAAHCYARDPA